MTKKLYIAATNQHVGKTTCTLGIVEAFRRKGIRVGYCKPVGQQTVDVDSLQVDKDAVLFSKVMGFDLVANLHSPVTLGPGVTQKYLENPDNFPFKQHLQHAAKILESTYEMMIYEGTGHPGVGSVVDISNADVARQLQAPVVLVAEGGVGNTLDRINLSLSLFREQNVPIGGVIINKVRPDKIELISHLVGMKLQEWDVPLLGLIPYDKSMLYPLLETVMKSIRGRVLYNPDGLNHLVEDVIAASLVEKYNFADANGLLLVTSANRFCEAIKRIAIICEAQTIDPIPLTGVVITGDGREDEDLSQFACLDFIHKHNIPVITTPLDTYGAAVQISKIEVKINVRTPGKARRAVELIRDYVDLEKIRWD